MFLWEAKRSLNCRRDKPRCKFSPAESCMLILILWILLQLLSPLLFEDVVVVFVELLLLLTMLLVVVVLLSWDVLVVLLVLFMVLLLLFEIECADLMSLSLFRSNSALRHFCFFSARLFSSRRHWQTETCNWISLPFIKASSVAFISARSKHVDPVFSSSSSLSEFSSSMKNLLFFI